MGPYAAKPAYDPVIQGFSGLATVQAGSDEARPRLLRTILPDKLTAITASQAITAALLARERTGEGQHVRLSMLEAVLAFLWPRTWATRPLSATSRRAGGGKRARPDLRNGRRLHHRGGADRPRNGPAWRERSSTPEWLEDERFKTSALRQQNIDARLRLTQEAC